MSRQRYPMVDNMATLSLLMSWGEDAQGHLYHVTVPMEGREFDGRPGEDALFGAFLAMSAFVPEAVRLTLLANDVTPAGGPLALDGSPVDPALDTRYSLQFLVEVGAAAGAGADLLVAAYGAQAGTAVEPTDPWPAITTTNTSTLEFSTPGGSPVDVRVLELS